MDLLTMDEVDVNDKTVLLRIDINVPVNKNTKEISESKRLKAHAQTIKELCEKGAKIVVLAHQGRKGTYDFIPLEQHAELLEKNIGRKVHYAPDLIGDGVVQKIEGLKSSEVLLLENVRFLEEECVERTPEEHSKGDLIQKLAPSADFYINDAYSAAHRSHASMVGFTVVLPSVAGRVMERELKTLEKIVNGPEMPSVLIAGGVKPKECIGVMKNMIDNDKIDNVLTCGTTGELFLMVRGYELGGPTKKTLMKCGGLELLDDVKKLIREYGNKIETPVDLAIEENGSRKEISVDNLPIDTKIFDVGTKTAEKYAEVVKDAKTIIVKGPVGVYEDPKFRKGTEIVFNAIAESDGFSLIGGGHTLSAIKELGIDESRFSYVSLGGGVLLKYLSGKSLPAVEALIAAKNRKY